MKKTLVLFCSIIVLFSACKNSAMMIAGIRNPKIENKKSILRFLKSIHQDTINTYSLDSNLFKSLCKEHFKPGWPPSFRPIQISAYNSNGKIVMKWASCEGFLKDLKTFDSVPPKNINGLDTTATLQEDLIRYFTLNGLPANIHPLSGYDYYFVVYFAKYFPKLSRESFLQIANYQARHPELKINTYKINVDVNEFWGCDIAFKVEMGKKGGHK